MPSLSPIRVFRGAPTQIIDEATQLSTVPARYTVPAGKRLIVKHIRITNLSASTANAVNLKTGTTISASDGDFVLRNVQVSGNDVVLFELSEILDAGDKIYLWQDAVSNVAIQISGVEVTL
jgi:hypothetical protein